MSSELVNPGLKKRRRKDGGVALYWIARSDLVKLGYRPETVRINYDPEDELQRRLISATCMRLQAEMLEWATGLSRTSDHFDGTILGLSRRYQTDAASPFQRLKHNTRKKDVYTLKIIENAFGSRSIASLKVEDFFRWYEAAKGPKIAGGPERKRKAYGIIKKLREMFSYGVMAEIKGCSRLHDILKHARFEQPARRRSVLSFDQVQIFIEVATKMGRQSLALATAIQFETALRQKDVIGEWIPVAASESQMGILLNGRQWTNGLTWQDISSDLVIRKATTKTGAFVAHDLKMCPLVFALLSEVPAERRIGPVIIDEAAGRPFAESAFGREWRIVANAAGIPRQVWNMDARAGAITEAEDAGADIDLIRSAAAHTQASTTQRYMRGALGKSRTVAALRIEHRAARNKT